MKLQEKTKFLSDFVAFRFYSYRVGNFIANGKVGLFHH